MTRPGVVARAGVAYSTMGREVEAVVVIGDLSLSHRVAEAMAEGGLAADVVLVDEAGKVAETVATYEPTDEDGAPCLTCGAVLPDHDEGCRALGPWE